MSAPLLALLQLSDSAFPSGGFAHSYGLEQALNQRIITALDEVESFVRSVLTQGAATSDARAAYAACDAVRDGDVTRIVAADLSLYRTKAAAELREACVQTGRRLINETAVHLAEPILQAYAGRVASGEAPGCHPVAFGVIGGVLGVAPSDAASALLLGTANALLQAAMRLGRISHRDTQAILHRLRPLIAGVDAVAPNDPSSWRTGAPLTLTLSLEGEGIGRPDEAIAGELRAYHPLQEIASMRHERAEARLFAS